MSLVAAPVTGAEQPAELPMAGTPVPELAAFDEAVQQFMRERGIRAGTLAVMKDGRVVLARGYGFADAQGKRLLGFDAPLRLASGSKPITAAAILKLIRAGKLTLDTKVFPLLAVAPSRRSKMDPRLNDITVRHLLDHQGGWDRAMTFDPMFRSSEIAESLGKPGPASSRDLIQYMLGQPLQFDPGSRRAYSNFGYCVLGRVIEKVTGEKYVTYIQKDLLAPLGIKSVELGRSLPKDRNAREPWYADARTRPNVMQPDSKVAVPFPDGGFHLEAMDAHGGLIGSGVDLLRFLQAYSITGEPRTGNPKGPLTFFGSLPGTLSMLHQRPDGVNIVALFNRGEPEPGTWTTRLRETLDATATGIKRWPTGK